MKNNKNKLSAIEQFQKSMETLLKNHYSYHLSESVKRGLRNKKKIAV